MDWDVFEIDAAPAQERGLVPEGRHQFTIKAASEGPHKFLEGEFLMLRLAPEERGWGLVFCDIGNRARDAALAASLAAAIGRPSKGRISLVPADLEGQAVAAVIRHVAKRDGTTRAEVASFEPAGAAAVPAEAPPARRRTATQKLDVEVRGGSSDDIPF